MKKYLPLILIIVILVVGVGILSYPLFSSVVNNIASRQTAEDHQKRIEKLDKDDKNALYAEADVYNQSLTDNVILTDPFDEEAYKRIGSTYKKAFNVTPDGLICYIDIPKINVYLPVYHGTSEETLAKTAGHLENTSIPVGGESTHAVISAHSAFPGETFFDYLPDLKEGDEFYIHILDRTLKYEVDQIKVVTPETTEDLRITKGEDYVTLITCTPYSINTHRLLVRGSRVPYDDNEYVVIEPPTMTFDNDCVFFLGYKIPYWAAAIAIAVILGVVVLIVVLVLRRSRRKKEKGGARFET